MNKLILGFFLLVASTSVMAEWIKIAETDLTDIYIDTKSIGKVEDYITMWSLYDYKSPMQTNSNASTYLSTKNLQKYDCQGNRTMDLAISSFTGSMGSGEVFFLHTYKDAEWSYPSPGSNGASILDYACGKKENIPKVNIPKVNISNESITSYFNSYPINTIYNGITAPLILDTPEARNYRTRLKDAINQPADFAGEFILARWGCGMDCVYGAAVSRKTGKVVFLPTTVCCWYGVDDKLQFQLNSSLLIANGSLNEGEEYGQFLYNFNGQEFKLINTIPIDKEMHISKSN